MLRLASVSIGCLTAAVIAVVACGSTDSKTNVRRTDAGAGAGGQGEAGGAAVEGGTTTTAGATGVASGGKAGDSTGPSGGTGPGGDTGLAGEPGLGGDTGLAGEPGFGGSAGLAGAGGTAPATIVDLDFDALPANLDPGTATLTSTEGFASLGPEGNKFGDSFLRGPTGTVITLTLSDLPAHTTLSLAMLFAAIDSLDGTGSFPAGDYFKITLDDVVVFRESFANATPDQIQTYEPPPAAILARHVDLGFSGPGGYYTDSAYDFGQDPRFQNLPHTASSAVLVFTLEGEGVQDITDESWAIDNLRVTVD